MMQVGDLAWDHARVMVGGARRSRWPMWVGALAALAVAGLPALSATGGGTAHWRLDRGMVGGGRGLSALPVVARLAVSRGLGGDDRSFWVTRRHARNMGQGLRFTFASRGVVVRARSGWVGFGSVALGRGDGLRRLPSVAPLASRNRVAYGLEWFVNGPLGLEQGFTVRSRPAGLSRNAVGLSVGLSGDLLPRLDGPSLIFGGVLRYGGLSVSDARGRALRAWLGLERGRLVVRFDDAGARYPVRVDPYIQVAKLTASDGAAGTTLGVSVAVSGSTVVAGTPDAIVNGQPRGAVYVFSEAAGGWADATQSAKLTASDGTAGDELGLSVAVSGTTVVAGALNATVGANIGQGAVYVFSEPATGWANGTQAAKLTASDGAASDNLGASVALSGATVIAGAPYVMVGTHVHQGAAYVFSEPPTGWANGTQAAKLTASDGAVYDQLGYSVAASGTTVVAGAPVATVKGTVRQGAAYVFSEPASGWADMTQSAKLTASDTGVSDALGVSVAVSGSTIVAGAEGTMVNGNTQQGAADVFSEPAGGWADMTETAELTASDGAAFDGLGFSVGVSGPIVVAGANDEMINGHFEQGAVYVFSEPAGGWADMTQGAELTASDGAANDQLGVSVGVSGATVVAGAPYATVDGNSEQGAAYVFVSQASTTTVATDASTLVSATAQNVSLSATVSSPAGAVNEGTVTFTVMEGSATVGAPTTSSMLNDGQATVTYQLPAGTAAGTYTIGASYNAGPDFQRSSDATHTLTVIAPPRSITPPSITGTRHAGSVLTCNTGQWTNSPTGYTYQWSRNGTPIIGATKATYRVVSLDDGSRLTCTVIASNQAGAAPASTSGAFVIPVPFVRRCPAATGRLAGSRLGLIRLGMSRRQARHAYTRSSTRGFAFKDFFCLTPRGTRVGYASPKLVRSLAAKERRRLRGRVVWASTSNPFYAVAGIRPGATLTAARAALPHGTLLHIGRNYWYLAPAGASTAVLKVRHGIVEEIGIALAKLTRSPRAKRTLMTSFD